MNFLKSALISSLFVSSAFAMQGYAPYTMKKNDWISKLLLERGYNESETLTKTLSVNKLNMDLAKKIAVGTTVYLPTKSDTVSASMSAPAKAPMTAPSSEMSSDSSEIMHNDMNTNMNASTATCFNNVWSCRISNFQSLLNR